MQLIPENLDSLDSENKSNNNPTPRRRRNNYRPLDFLNSGLEETPSNEYDDGHELVQSNGRDDQNFEVLNGEASGFSSVGEGLCDLENGPNPKVPTIVITPPSEHNDDNIGEELDEKILNGNPNACIDGIYSDLSSLHDSDFEMVEVISNFEEGAICKDLIHEFTRALNQNFQVELDSTPIENLKSIPQNSHTESISIQTCESLSTNNKGHHHHNHLRDHIDRCDKLHIPIDWFYETSNPLDKQEIPSNTDKGDKAIHEYCPIYLMGLVYLNILSPVIKNLGLRDDDPQNRENFLSAYIYCTDYMIDLMSLRV